MAQLGLMVEIPMVKLATELNINTNLPASVPGLCLVATSCVTSVEQM